MSDMRGDRHCTVLMTIVRVLRQLSMVLHAALLSLARDAWHRPLRPDQLDHSIHTTNAAD
jgi:hypothetical protein